MKGISYRIAGDVDNQLGQLHTVLRSLIPKGIGLPLVQYDKEHSNVYMVKDVIPRDLAERTRSFFNDIPFDNTLEQLNNDTNPPRQAIFTTLTQESIKDAYSNRRYDPNDWAWEKYHRDFWRAVPLSGESYCGSPIVELMDVLEERWHATDMDKLWGSECEILPKDLRKLTWVVQRVEQGHGMGFHNDDFGDRKLAFIYYLTPDDWDYTEDGGELRVCYYDKADHLAIDPEFNTMIVWDMYRMRSPLHGVNTVKCSNKARIALVGFLG